MVYWEEFNKVSGSEAQKRAQLDFDDHQNEAAGRDVGRIRRFLTGAQHDPETIKKRREEQETAFYLAIKHNAELARLYEEAAERLRETRQFLDDTREKLVAIRAGIEAQEQDILSRAARLPDGTLVFLGEDGRAYTRDGKLSDDPAAQNIIWQNHHATLSEIQLSDQRRELLEQAEVKVNAHDAELGSLEERYKNTDDLTADDLKDISKQVEEISSDLSKSMEALHQATASPAPQTAISVPAQIRGLDNL
ncbi:hypothetical protein [Labrenzia sp. R5_0]|uniref:hypothetical protein n=1 Tax=Labrenzia sp. R5_0 TaxID=2821108 RepID=UPI001ADC5F9A|nr:hypothetical protein [Labrenzia sp. R5_0]MBO9462468.1 hypothetical protein [Labrenzia sp. R5_0]